MSPPAAEPGPASQAEFVWPPLARAGDPIDHDDPGRDLSSPPLPPASGAPPLQVVSARGWARQIEDDLLGVRALSFARWAEAAGWRPDAPGDFCWRCAGSVGPHEVDGAGCTACRGKRLTWDRAARLGVYEDGLRAAVIGLKFGRWRRTGVELGRAMGRRLAEELAAGAVDPAEAVIVPVPTSWRRRMGRGVDHGWVLARAAGAEAGVRVVRGLARRHGRPQVGLSATARAANIRGVFLARKILGRQGSRVRVVVVTDDVRTTGATLTAACRTVRGVTGKSPQIWVLSGAVACDRGGGRAQSGVEGEKIAKSFDAAV